MIRTFALNSTWPGYRPTQDPVMFMVLVLITLILESAAVYGWYYSEHRSLGILILVVIVGNVVSAIIGFLVVMMLSAF